MKTVLLAGGILLLLLGAVLLIAAVVVFLMGRKKAAGGAPAMRPAGAPAPQAMAPQVPAPQAMPIPPPPVIPPPAPAPAPPPPPAPVIDNDATIVAGSLGLGSLQAISGKLAGHSFPLQLDGVYIGRDRALAQIVIDDPSVSKRHVWVGVREGVPTAIDQSSTNGTYLNTLGTRIGQVRLTPGDTIIISDDVARFVYKA